MFASAMNRLSGRSKKPDTVKPSEGVTTRRAFGRDITNANPETIDTSAKDSTSKDVSADVDADAIEIDMENDVVAAEPVVQQRPYMLRPSDDIDIRDVDNPLLCTEYVNEMYDIFNDTEKEYAVKPNYLSGQQYINEKMRSILCDWLVSCIGFSYHIFTYDLVQPSSAIAHPIYFLKFISHTHSGFTHTPVYCLLIPSCRHYL